MSRPVHSSPSWIVDIPDARRSQYGAVHLEETMTGQLSFYDRATAWGLIWGDDGRLYVVRGGQLAGPLPRVGERVSFEPRATEGGLRADEVKKMA